MSTCCLGDTFDIHGGGPDLLFPHHENEIAQSECATGHTFVNTWMHAGAIRVNKEKMSKSLGNFFTIREIMEKYPAEVVRYFLVSSHYRSQVDYSEENLAEAGRTLTRLYHALRGIVPAKAADVPESEHDERFAEAMDDDFNTAGAIAVLHAVANEINQHRRDGREEDAKRSAAILVRLGGVLGLLQQDPEAFFQADTGGELSAEDIEAMIQPGPMPERRRILPRPTGSATSYSIRVLFWTIPERGRPGVKPEFPGDAGWSDQFCACRHDLVRIFPYNAALKLECPLKMKGESGNVTH